MWVKFVRLSFLFGNIVRGYGRKMIFFFLKTKNLSLPFLGCTENTAYPYGFLFASPSSTKSLIFHTVLGSPPWILSLGSPGSVSLPPP